MLSSPKIHRYILSRIRHRRFIAFCMIFQSRCEFQGFLVVGQVLRLNEESLLSVGIYPFFVYYTYLNVTILSVLYYNPTIIRNQIKKEIKEHKIIKSFHLTFYFASILNPQLHIE